MPNQYLLQQRGESSITDICGIDDIVETGSNANGYYCRFANGFQIMLMSDSRYFSGNQGISANLTTPALSVAGSGSGSGYPQSQPGGRLMIVNLWIFQGYINVFYSPLDSSWSGYSRAVNFIVISRWR